MPTPTRHPGYRRHTQQPTLPATNTQMLFDVMNVCMTPKCCCTHRTSTWRAKRCEATATTRVSTHRSKLRSKKELAAPTRRGHSCVFEDTHATRSEIVRHQSVQVCRQLSCKPHTPYLFPSMRPLLTSCHTGRWRPPRQPRPRPRDPKI